MKKMYVNPSMTINPMKLTTSMMQASGQHGYNQVGNFGPGDKNDDDRPGDDNWDDDWSWTGGNVKVKTVINDSKLW